MGKKNAAALAAAPASRGQRKYMTGVTSDSSGYDGSSEIPSFGLEPGNKMPTRMCDFRLCTGNFAYLDFLVSLKDDVSLERISMDGFGCNNCSAPAMDKRDGSLLLRMVLDGKIEQEECRRIIICYFTKNADAIGWTDALEEYKLIDAKL